MANTSLGVTIWSKWIGGGMKEAHREIGQLEDRMRKVNSSFLLASGRSSMLQTSMMALAPAVKTLGGVMAGTAAAGGAAFIAASAAAGIYGKVMSETVKRTNEARAAGQALNEDQRLYVVQMDRLKSAWERLLKAQESNTLHTASIAVDGMKHAVERLNPILDATQGIIMRNAEAWRDWTMRDDGMKRFADNVAKYGAPYLNGLLLAGREALGGLGYLFREALEHSNGMVKSLLQGSMAFNQWAAGGGFQRFFEWVVANQPVVDAFFDALVAAFKNLTSSVGTLGPVMLQIATSILNFIASVDPKVIVAFYLAMLSLKVISHISAMVLILTTAIKGLSAAMMFLYANPIVLAIIAIVAVFVILWVKVEAFRNFWKMTWDLIVQGATWAWENGIKPAMDALGKAWDWLWKNAIKPAIDAIGAGMTWLWQKAIKPAIDWIVENWPKWMHVAKNAWENVLWPVIQFIGAAVMWLWENIFKPVIDKIVANWPQMASALKSVWENVLQPIFSGLGNIVMWLWENVLSPVFTWFKDHWSDICGVIQFVWNYILKPVFFAVGEVVKFIWNTVISVIFALIADLFSVVCKLIEFAWNYILKPVFTAVGNTLEFLWNLIVKPIFELIGWWWGVLIDGIKWSWENVLKPVWEALVSAFEWVRDKIGAGIDDIGRFWNGLKEMVKAPVEWIVNTVWNNGLVKAWNWINDLWGGTDVPPFNFNAGSSGGGGAPMKAYATGGPVRGPGTGTSDSIAARLSNGEHVWTAREVQAAGGHGGVAALRSAVMGGAAVRASSDGPGFAEGGFWGGVKDFFTPGTGAGFSAISSLVPSLSTFDTVAKGLRGTIDSASGISGHMVGMAKGVGTKALDAVVAFVKDKLMPKFSGGGGGMGWKAMWDIVRGAFPDSTLTSSQRNTNDYHGSGQAIDVAWPMTQFGKSKMLELNKWIATRYPDSTELIHTPGTNLKNGRPFTYSADTQAAHHDHVHWAMAGGPGGAATSGDGWRSLALQELAHFGQPASLVDTVLRRLQQESGGNARAINNWDSNAAAGTPSKGLMQVIDPTFNAYKGGGHPNDIWDPGANMHAAFAYAMSRYGSLSNAFNRPGGYALGTNGARSGWNWVGERGAELVKFRGGEKVLNQERLARMGGASRGSDRPMVDTGGAPLIDARGATKEAVDKLNKDTLPQLTQMLKQLRG